MALIALAGRTLPGIPRGARTMLAYAGMAVVLIASYRLHVAVLGEGQMYGSRAEQFSLAAYLVAPFGLPLLVGGSLVLIFDLLRCSFSPSSRPGHP
jgi:hypothetical protein